MIIGVGLVLLCCVMFIHLGLGDTICRIIHFDFILFRCVKCLTFWSVLSYTLFVVNIPILESLSTAFILSYISLWMDLILAKIACKYDIWYKETEEDMGANDKQEDSRDV